MKASVNLLIHFLLLSLVIHRCKISAGAATMDCKLARHDDGGIQWNATLPVEDAHNRTSVLALLADCGITDPTLRRRNKGRMLQGVDYTSYWLCNRCAWGYASMSVTVSIGSKTSGGIGWEIDRGNVEVIYLNIQGGGEEILVWFNLYNTVPMRQSGLRIFNYAGADIYFTSGSYKFNIGEERCMKNGRSSPRTWVRSVSGSGKWGRLTSPGGTGNYNWYYGQPHNGANTALSFQSYCRT